MKMLALAFAAASAFAPSCQEAAISEGNCASGLRMRCPAALPPAKAIPGVPLLVEDLSDRVHEGDGLPTYAVSVLYHEWPGHVRSPIKQYDQSGMLCVKRGQIRLVLQGAAGKVAKTGECLLLPQEPLSVVSSDSPAQFFLYTASPGYREVDGRICEPSSQWSLGIVGCPTCSEVHEQQCKTYATCAGRSNTTTVPPDSCDYECAINGEPAPTVQWLVPTTGRSDNAGKVVAMEPSYPVQGGHSGDMLDFYAVSGSGRSNFPGDNHRLYAERTTRIPFTRALVHTHDWSGVTCVQQGEMTLLLDKVQPVTVREGECYWMPAGRYMTGMNTGNVTALMWDLYALPAETQQALPYTTIDLLPIDSRAASKDAEEDDICRAEGGVLVDGATVRPLSPKERFDQSASLVRRIKEICDLTAGTLEPLLAPYPACECIGQFDETGSVEWAL